MEQLNWLQHHFMEISLLWFPALLGWLNCAIVILKIWGFTGAAEFCGKLEDSLKVVVDTAKQSQQTKGQ